MYFYVVIGGLIIGTLKNHNDDNIKTNVINDLHSLSFSRPFLSFTTTNHQLITISLFKYTDDVSCPEFVRYNHVLFCRLLHRYLESKYQDGERANLKYDSLMGFSEQMWAIKELICETYVDMDVAVAATVLDGIYHFSRAEVF